MLTPKQEAFARNIVEGMSQADAYRSAYSCKRMSDKTIREAACRLMSNSNVTAMVNELREQANTRSVMSAQRRREWLTEVIEDPDVDLNVRLKASDQLNRMTGEYVTKVEGNLNVTKLEDLI